ncbi:MAG TPA: hypothetical protein VJ850_01965, partial [Candidatus Limnocylindrales bacterium]|nr:hypothetical protein [Candidatus Limnocylindrales bacterium]
GPVAQASDTPVPATTLPTAEETPVPAASVLNPTDNPSSTCIGFNTPTEYTQNAGTLPITVTVPASATEGWSGFKDTFRLVGAPCESDGSPDVEAELLAHLNADACSWRGSSIEEPTAVDLAHRLGLLKNVDTTTAVDTYLGVFRATRIDVSVPASFDASACDDGAITLWDGMVLDPGWTVQVYVAEVDGSTVVLTANYPTNLATSSRVVAIQSIIQSLRIVM